MEACTNPDILRVIYFFSLILDIVKIIVPIGIIVFGIIGFSKAVISGDEKEQKKSFNLFGKRLLYGVLIFAVPWIVEVFMITLGDLIDKDNMGNFTDCLENANSECIDALDSKNINTIKSICDVPEDFKVEEDTSNQDENVGQNQTTNQVCWQCNDNPNLYQWGESAKSDSNCHAGWHELNRTKEQCPVEKCYYCTGVPNYVWSTSKPSSGCTGGVWSVVSKNKNECAING